jgi:hypothetical protein
MFFFAAVLVCQWFFMSLFKFHLGCRFPLLQ